MLAAHGNVLGSGNEACEGVPEFVWIMPKIHANCCKQNICSPCTLNYTCPRTSYRLQQRYHPPIRWCGDCSPGNQKRTRAARSCGVISVTPSLAVVHLHSSAQLPAAPRGPASCYREPLAAPRPTQAIPSAPTTSWGGFAGQRLGKDLFYFFLSGPFNLYNYSNFLLALLLGPGRARRVLPPGGGRR